MNNLIIDSKFEKLLGSMLNNPAHAILFTGNEGVGLKTIALSWAKQFDANQPVLEIDPDEKGTISIETVRELYLVTRDKTDKLMILIDDADAMGSPAQNSLLKLLEEPIQNVHFILTTHNPARLLPTVISRLQVVRLPVLSLSSTAQMLKIINLPDVIKKQLQFLAGGLPAEMQRLIDNDEYRTTQIQAANTAKHFLVGSRQQQLQLINDLVSSRPAAIEFISLLIRMVELQLASGEPERLLGYLDKLIEVKDNLVLRNGHIRAQLLLAVK